MKGTPEEIIDRFEAKCIKAIMAQGFNSGEARDIFDDWLARTAKRRQAHKLGMMMMQIR